MKLDLYKTHQADYVATGKPALLTIAPAKYLTIEGQGEPGGAIFELRVGALYNVAFTIKMESKFAGQDYGVSKLEGLWWSDGAVGSFLDTPRSQWQWKLLIRTPDFITSRQLKETHKKLLAKGKAADVGEVGLETLREGRCVQVLHTGPYSEEPQTIQRMEDFSAAQGLSFHGLHHEIYLSDPRRVAPAKLKTILRVPVK